MLLLLLLDWLRRLRVAAAAGALKGLVHLPLERGRVVKRAGVCAAAGLLGHLDLHRALDFDVAAREEPALFGAFL